MREGEEESSSCRRGELTNSKEVLRGKSPRTSAEVRAAGHPGRGDLGRAESLDVKEVAGDLTEQVVLHPCLLTVQVAKPCATADLKMKDTELMAHGPQVEAERFDQLRSLARPTSEASVTRSEMSRRRCRRPLNRPRKSLDKRVISHGSPSNVRDRSRTPKTVQAQGGSRGRRPDSIYVKLSDSSARTGGPSVLLSQPSPTTLEENQSPTTAKFLNARNFSSCRQTRGNSYPSLKSSSTERT